MVLEGLAGLPGKGQELQTDVKQASRETVRVLAACQALIQVDGKFVGDPLEKASFTATGQCHTNGFDMAAVCSWDTYCCHVYFG